VSPTRYQLCH